ncbi:UDP-N-acetylglucosamine 1-carboxyvinyltransferase [Candidatus Daviesbacteria bacterium]|nr:UDP-N-acetylglucosamine 1-carboxyvinyltransferase [Candidatus Daviesbacteria bacterium]
MAKFEITGGRPLIGQINAGANKNGILPVMAASLLTDEDCILENVPDIGDVKVLGQILRELGAVVEKQGEDTLKINTSKVTKHQLSSELVAQLRGSVLLLGPLVKRLGKVKMRHPGGDIIGRRSIDVHLDALSQLGVSVKVDDNSYELSAGKLTGVPVFLVESSVTATENVIMAAVLAEGTTVIKHAASEPHVADLCKFLNKMGAKISGVGSNLLMVEGVSRLRGITHRIPSDHIEVGTFAVAAAVTQGDITINDVQPEDMDMIVTYLKKMGVDIKLVANNSSEHNQSPWSLQVKSSKLTAIRKIDTDPWPGFPTDLTSVFTVLATQAAGTTLVHDWMYEGRMFFVDKLINMGANIILCDPHRAVVAGPTKLVGRELDSPDLRAGMALVLAALAADGRSTIDRIEQVERGYGDVEKRFKSLGAAIKRVD